MRRALLTWLTLTPMSSVGEDGGVGGESARSRAALVRFHTACTTCHASECSGRLSFQSGASAANGHVRRYAPSAPEPVVRELFSLLASLKRTCRHDLPVLPASQRYDAAFLHEHFNPDASAWFVPLAARERATIIDLELGGSGQAEVMVLDEALETLVEQRGEGRLRLEAPAGRRAFLLVRGATSFTSLVVGTPR